MTYIGPSPPGGAEVPSTKSVHYFALVNGQSIGVTYGMPAPYYDAVSSTFEAVLATLRTVEGAPGAAAQRQPIALPQFDEGKR